MEYREDGVPKLPPDPELDKLEDAMYMSACNAILMSDFVQMSNENFPNKFSNQESDDALPIDISNSTSSQQEAENEDIINVSTGIRGRKIDSAKCKTGAKSVIAETETDITIIYDKALSGFASQSFMSPEVRNDNRLLKTTNAAVNFCDETTFPTDRASKFLPGLPPPTGNSFPVQRLSKEVDKIMHIPDPSASHRITSDSDGYPLEVSRSFIPSASLINNPIVTISEESSHVTSSTSSAAFSLRRNKVNKITTSSETLVSRSEISNSALSSAQSVSPLSNPCVPNSFKCSIPKTVQTAFRNPFPSGSSPIQRNEIFSSDRTQRMKRLSGISTRKKTASKSVQTVPFPPSTKSATDPRTHKDGKSSNPLLRDLLQRPARNSSNKN